MPLLAASRSRDEPLPSAWIRPEGAASGAWDASGCPVASTAAAADAAALGAGAAAPGAAAALGAALAWPSVPLPTSSWPGAEAAALAGAGAAPAELPSDGRTDGAVADQHADEAERRQADGQRTGEAVARGPDPVEPAAEAAALEPSGIGVGELEVARPPGCRESTVGGDERQQVGVELGARGARGELRVEGGTVLGREGAVDGGGEPLEVVGGVIGRGSHVTDGQGRDGYRRTSQALRRGPASGGSPGSVRGVGGITAGPCVLRDGGAWCWDPPSTAYGASASPDLESGVAALASRSALTCALKDGEVLCLNRDAGEGVPSVWKPIDVGGRPGGVSAISVGGDRACAVKEEGGVWCWGNSHDGLFDNTATESPAPVPGLEHGVIAVSTGSDHACALTIDGVWCWGDDGPGPARHERYDRRVRLRSP